MLALNTIILDLKAILSVVLDISPFKNTIKQLSVDDTIKIVNQKKISLARFGDGELSIMAKDHGVGFQEKNELLADRLLEVFLSNEDRLLIELPDQFSYLQNSVRKTRKFWIGFINEYYKFINTNLSHGQIYGNTNISRFYMVFRQKSKAKSRFNQLKAIWENKNLLIIEGELSRSGVGNDLYTNANSIKRLLCPAKNAFNFYEEILELAKEKGQNKLILMALGPTATVLAYDLAKLNYWCLDLGHLDVEYMWMLHNAKTKTSVQGRYVNESTDKVIGEELSDYDLKEYSSQVVAKIGI